MENLKYRINDLLAIVSELEDAFPGRKFTLDGHLLGSIGEVMASHYYGIELYPNSNKLYDGVVNGKEIQIKITQGTSVDIVGVPEYLIVLFLCKKEAKVYEVYNGPGRIVVEGTKPTKSGWYNRSLVRLSKLDKELEGDDRLAQVNTIDKWSPSIRN